MATTIASTCKRKTDCGIKRERHLENEAIEKTSVKGDFPQLATDIQAGLYLVQSCCSACIVCSCCAMFIKEINVRSTFDGGRSSYIVV